jgi:hypothetical protein
VLRAAGLTAFAAALLAAPALPALAQTSEDEVGVPPAPPAGWQAPRTEWGDPDFRGSYPLDLGRTRMQRDADFGTRKLLTPEEYGGAVEAADFAEAGADREDEANTLGSGNWFEYGRALRQTSLIVEPADGRIHMNAEGERRAALMKSSWSQQVFDGIEDFNSLDHCITRGLPASMIPFPYNNGLRVFQSPGHVAINLEMIHETRIIPLDNQPRLPGQIDLWTGSSRGHFEGNTLVVETTNFNGEAPMVIVGPSNQPIPTSKSMRIVEHFTLYGPEQVFYEAWIEDPEVLSEPFKLGFPWRRDDSYEPFEYACHEGNTLVRAYITATSPRYEEYRRANGGE